MLECDANLSLMIQIVKTLQCWWRDYFFDSFGRILSGTYYQDWPKRSVFLGEDSTEDEEDMTVQEVTGLALLNPEI
jgi:hypothetical protein